VTPCCVLPTMEPHAPLSPPCARPGPSCVASSRLPHLPEHPGKHTLGKGRLKEEVPQSPGRLRVSIGRNGHKNAASGALCFGAAHQARLLVQHCTWLGLPCCPSCAPAAASTTDSTCGVAATADAPAVSSAAAACAAGVTCRVTTVQPQRHRVPPLVRRQHLVVQMRLKHQQPPAERRNKQSGLAACHARAPAAGARLLRAGRLGKPRCHTRAAAGGAAGPLPAVPPIVKRQLATVGLWAAQQQASGPVCSSARGAQEGPSTVLPRQQAQVPAPSASR
jgi:hypothetical protein